MYYAVLSLSLKGSFDVFASPRIVGWWDCGWISKGYKELHA
jgi:hypothetical protein